MPGVKGKVALQMFWYNNVNGRGRKHGCCKKRITKPFLKFIQARKKQNADSSNFLPNKTPSCIWVSIPDDWVILYWWACGADGRVDARMVRWLQNFFGWISNQIYLAMGLCSRAWVELCYNYTGTVTMNLN